MRQWHWLWLLLLWRSAPSPSLTPRACCATAWATRATSPLAAMTVAKTSPRQPPWRDTNAFTHQQSRGANADANRYSLYHFPCIKITPMFALGFFPATVLKYMSFIWCCWKGFRHLFVHICRYWIQSHKMLFTLRDALHFVICCHTSETFPRFYKKRELYFGR